MKPNAEGSYVLDQDQSVELFNKAADSEKPLTGMDGLFNSVVDDQNKKLSITVSQMTDLTHI